MNKKSIELRSLSKWILGLILVPTLVLSSCKKDDDTDSSSSKAMTEEEASEVVEGSLSDSNGGMEDQVVYACNHVVNNIDTAQCNVNYYVTVSGSNPTGSVITYDFDYNWKRTITCNTANNPQSFSFQYEGDLAYDAPRMSSDDVVEGNFLVTGIDDPNAWVFSANYSKVGTQQSKVGSNRSFTTTVQVVIESITVDKSSLEIESGTGTVLVSGYTNLGLSYSHTGTIVFNGNGSVTLTWSTGVVYDLDV